MTSAVLFRGAVPLAVNQKLQGNGRGRQWARHTSTSSGQQIPFEELPCLVESQMRRWLDLGSTWDLPQQPGLDRSMGWALSQWQSCCASLHPSGDSPGNLDNRGWASLGPRGLTYPQLLPKTGQSQ